MTKELYIFNNQIHFDREPIAQLLIAEDVAASALNEFITVETSNEMEDKARDEGYNDGCAEGWQDAIEFIDHDLNKTLFDGVKITDKQKEKILDNMTEILERAQNAKK